MGPGLNATDAAIYPQRRQSGTQCERGTALSSSESVAVAPGRTGLIAALAVLAAAAAMVDGFVLLLPARHALAKGRRALAWSEVADLTHISMPLPTSVRQYADAALLQHRLRFAPRYEVEHLATIHAMVAAGLGVAALPELAAAVAPVSGVVRRRLVAPDILRPIGLVTRRGRSLSPASAEMVALLREEVQRLVPRRRQTAAAPAGGVAV